MRVGVVDVGGNTARLLIATVAGSGLERVAEDRAPLRLGAEIERADAISQAKLDETAATVARFLDLAADAGCVESEVLVTSPGRQSGNREALARSLARVAGGRVRFVSAEEEGTLAFIGALAGTSVESDRVAVCDVGGGSTEIAFGLGTSRPTWVRSLDLGSLRLARRHFRGAQPTKKQIREARMRIRSAIEELAPPRNPRTTALATGGTARAVRRIVGPNLGRDELAAALTVAVQGKPGKLAERYGLPAWRIESLAAGVLLLSELRRSLGTPLIVSSGGLREGAAIEMLRRTAQAA